MAVICFDYDGVIADTYALESTYYLDIYKQHGIHLFETGEDLRNACRGNFYEFCEKNGLTSALLDQIFEEYNRYLEDHQIAVPLFDGIVDLLKVMLEKHTVYIVSLNDSDVIAARLEKEGISGFADILGWQQATSKAESLPMVMARHPEEELYFISDSIGDMKEAASVEFPHILAVSYGWGSGKDLMNAGAHVLFDTVAELAAYLNNI